MDTVQVRRTFRQQQLALRNQMWRVKLKNEIMNLEGHIEYHQKLYEAEHTRKPIAYPHKASCHKITVEGLERTLQSKRELLERYESSDDEGQ